MSFPDDICNKLDDWKKKNHNAEYNNNSNNITKHENTP